MIPLSQACAEIQRLAKAWAKTSRARGWWGDEVRADDEAAEAAFTRALAALAAQVSTRDDVVEECACDRDKSVDPHCSAAGMCSRENDNG